jgi:hypothetical protein
MQTSVDRNMSRWQDENAHAKGCNRWRELTSPLVLEGVGYVQWYRQCAPYQP